MTLYLWKGPVTEDPDEAKRLIERWDERGDDSAFEASPEIAKVADELIRRFPDAEHGPWADDLPAATDRIIYMTIRWGADNAVLDAIAELAYAHGLVLYDPQGPNVGLATDPSMTVPDEPIRAGDYLTFVAMLVAAVGVFWLGWWIEVPVLNWILMIVGGFFVSVTLFLIAAMIFGPKADGDEPRRSAK